jgi:predicted transport protein
MTKEDSVVGELINFRGLVYSPINEQGVVFLFGRLLEDLNMYIEEVRIKYPDCIARRYTGTGWKKVYIEFEYLSSNFIQHKHNPKECDIIVCWIDDLTTEQKKQIEGIEIIELKSLIKDPEVKNMQIKAPEKEIEKSKYDITHHFIRSNVNENVKKIYNKLHEEILKINPDIFRKFSRTAITYYSPEKMFIYIRLQKTSVKVSVYTNQKDLKNIKNFTNHENWGTTTIFNEKDIKEIILSLKQSYDVMKEAIKENINTGWFALSPGEHLEEDEEGNTEEETKE